MQHNPASIVRLLYGERAARENRAEAPSLRFCPLQSDIRASHRSRPIDFGGSDLAAALLGTVPFGSICRDQSAVAMGSVCGWPVLRSDFLPEAAPRTYPP